MMLGELWMPVWPADSLDTLHTVCYLNCILKVCVAIEVSCVLFVLSVVENTTLCVIYQLICHTLFYCMYISLHTDYIIALA